MTGWRITGETIFPKGDNPLGNRFYGYRKLDLTLPDGRAATYHGVDVGPCVHVVALEDDETTYLVRQHRPNAMRVGGLAIPETVELPGGFANPDDIFGSAQSELQQEIGKKAAIWNHVGTLYTAPGLSNEEDYIFMATGLSPDEIAEPAEATEQDLGLIVGKFGVLYGNMQREELPVSAQTLAAMAKVAARL